MAKKKKSKKSKNDRISPNLQPGSVLGSESPSPKILEGEDALDRVEPEQIFHSAQEIDFLHPKVNSKDRKQDDNSENYGAIKYLELGPMTTPATDIPPTLLLTLIGNFFTGYGLNSTSRIFQIELASKMKLNGWKVDLEQEVPFNYPDLVTVFRQQHKQYSREVYGEETSSSESGNDDDGESLISETSAKLEKSADEGQVDGEEDTTSSESSSDASEDSASDSDPETQNTSSKLGASKRREPSPKESSSESPSDNTSESSEDEEELSAGQIKVKDLQVPSKLSDNVGDMNKATEPVPKHIPRSLGGQIGQLESEESSASDSDSEDNKHSLRTTKQTTLTATSLSTETSSSDSSSAAESTSEESTTHIHPTKASTATSETTSSDITSDSELSAAEQVESIPSIASKNSVEGRNGSSSSETLQATPVQRISTANTSLSSTAITSDASASNPVSKNSTAKRKRSSSQSGPGEDTVSNKKHHGPINTVHKNVPFQRVPKDTPTDERFSNKYKSYDYADQAHYDLSITKGKGFTKEKNKKKRGSYRGGPIDISGGRGIKFED